MTSWANMKDWTLRVHDSTYAPLMGDDRNNRHNASTKELHQHWHHRGNVWNLFSALTQSSSGSIYWVNSIWGKNEREKEKGVKNVSTPMTVSWKSTKRNTCSKIAAKMHKSVGKSHIIWSFRQWETKYYPKRERSRFNVTGWGRGVWGDEREKRHREKSNRQKSWFLQCWNLQPKQQTWRDHLSFPPTFFLMYFMTTN